MIDALLRSGRQEAAHEIALLARNRYPAIRDITPAALEVRNPEILIAIASKPRDAEVVIPLIEARQELAALHTSMQTGQWDLALSHIGNIEKSPLAKELGDQLLYHRITIHGYLSNQTEISLYLRRLLASGRLDVARIRNLATDLHEPERFVHAGLRVHRVAGQHGLDADGIRAADGDMAHGHDARLAAGVVEEVGAVAEEAAGGHGMGLSG